MTTTTISNITPIDLDCFTRRVELISRKDLDDLASREVSERILRIYDTDLNATDTAIRLTHHIGFTVEIVALLDGEWDRAASTMLTVPNEPSLATSYSDNTVTLLRSEIRTSIGSTNHRVTRPVAGATIAAAIVAERIADIISDSHSDTVIASLASARQELADYLSEKAAEAANQERYMAALRRECGSHIHNDRARVRVTVPRADSRDIQTVTNLHHAVTVGLGHWLSEENAIVEYQLKPRARWRKIVA